MSKHKNQESTTATVFESSTTASTEAKHVHDIHESSDADNIYRSCRTCPFSETIPRK